MNFMNSKHRSSTANENLVSQSRYALNIKYTLDFSKTLFSKKNAKYLEMIS